MNAFFGSLLLIFVLRVVDVSLAIIRILMVMRGRKSLAWIMGFFQAIVFVTAIRQVLTDLDSIWNMLAYAAGFATGTVVGIWLEEKLAVGYGHVRIMSLRFGAQLTSVLRESGYAVTQFSGRGRDGNVDVLSCSVPRRQVQLLTAQVMTIDPEAFITVENVHPVHRGFWRR